MNPVFALKRTDTWWETGEVDKTFLHKRIRSEFSSISKSLSNTLITRLIGPTGVGKTSLLYDTVNFLLQKGTPKERILLFSGDDMSLFGEHCSVGSLLETYSTDVVHENLFEFTNPVYILIDDVQFLEDWQIYLYNYRTKAPFVKFIVAQVFEINDEYDDENVENISVMPLTQPQFTEFYCANREAGIDLVRFKSLLPNCSIFENVSACYSNFSENIYPLSEYKPYKSKVINDYLFAGGYPAFFGIDSKENFIEYLQKTVDMAIYRDVAALSGLKAPQKLKRLLYIISEREQLEQSYGSLGRSLYVDTSTIIGYVNALTKCGYAGVAENYSLLSSVEGRVVRKNKKFYIFDLGVYNSVLNRSEITSQYENCVRRSTMYFARREADKLGGSIYFWKDGKRFVDTVFSKGRNILPISICCSRENTDITVKNLRTFMRTYSVKKGLIITKNVLKSEGNIYFIPYWLI